MDRLTAEARSANMRAVRRRDTAPEMAVRRLLYSAGYRYRLHAKKLPGAPDIILQRYRVAVFVHGCFWHSHNCPRGRRPTSRSEFWNPKLDKNLERDRRSQAALRAAGWQVAVIWECRIPQGCRELLRSLNRARRRQATLSGRH